MGKKIHLAILLTAPAVYLLFFFVVPLGIMVTYAFREGGFDEARHIFTWEHFRIFFSTPSFHKLLFQSVILAFITAVLSVLFAYPLAYFLAFEVEKHKIFLLTLLVIPAWTSWLLRVLAWKLLLDSTGFLNSLLLSSGIIKNAAPLLLYSRTSVVITLVYICIPFAAIPLFSALESVDRHLLEASADLGGSRFTTFFKVTLPASFSGIIAAFFFIFIPTLGEWVTPTLVGGAQGIMYGNLIQEQFIKTLNWPMGSLMSIVMLLLVLPALVIFIRKTSAPEYTTV